MITREELKSGEKYFSNYHGTHTISVFSEKHVLSTKINDKVEEIFEITYFMSAFNVIPKERGKIELVGYIDNGHYYEVTRETYTEKSEGTFLEIVTTRWV